MNVLIDTCVWSLVLRRHKKQSHDHQIITQEILRLIKEHRAVIAGPILQELLSGIKTAKHFDKLSQQLTAFNTLSVCQNDYVLAAKLYNQCRSKGIQGSHIDFLICALAINHDMAIFTVDQDFARYAECCPIVLHTMMAK